MMDPFLGIGHAAIAAKQYGIHEFVGFDIDPSYVRLARGALLKGSTEPTVELLEDASHSRRSRRNSEETLFNIDGES